MQASADPPMIVRSLKAGGFLRVNCSFLARVGFDEADLAQGSLEDWLVPEDRPAFRAALDSGAEVCVVRHRAKDGQPLEIELRMRAQGENPVLMGRCAETVAARRESTNAEPETTVKSTLHKIAEIVEQQNPGYKCSILLVAHGRFVKGAGPSLPEDYNNAVDGYAIGPTVGACGTAIYWNVPVIVADIQKDPLWADLAALAKKAGVAACWSHPFTTKGGRVLGALALYSPVPKSPTVEQISRLRAAAAMTGLAVERGRAEEELRSANAVKERFMANLSHEIRTPLNALIGTADSLENVQDPELQREIDLMRESGEQLLELFSGALELTEVQDRKHQEKVIDLWACCRKMRGRLEESADRKGLHVLFLMSGEVPQWVSVDEWALERTLGLLLSNAVKFTESGSIHFEFGFEGERLSVRIADTGCGIDLERLAELRKPFVQGDLSTTKMHAGFGLGLAVSDLCLQALGGELVFSANEPQGTIVRFEIPVHLAKPLPAAPPKSEPSSAALQDLPVLVAEDNELNGKVIRWILERAGYRCQVAENGQEALEAMERGSFSAVLMDCQMPVLDGYETTKRIREIEAKVGGRIPIIAVTANALANDREMCLQAGMDDYLNKPVRKHELVATLEEQLRRPRAS